MSAPIATRARRAKAEAARKDASRIRARNGLLDGERLIRFYCVDTAGCSCPPLESCGGIPTIRVGRMDGSDRCLSCGSTWPERNYRDEARPVRRGSRAGWLDDYMRSEEVTGG